jgi:hypothetical protein
MSFREYPMLLRQSFTKLWPNNIFLSEEKPESLHFLSFYHTKILLQTVLHSRYTKLVASRTDKNGANFDEYVNFYKYQKNERRKKKRRIRGRWYLIPRDHHQLREERSLTRDPNQRFLLPQRFLKTSIYQQLFHELVEVVTKLFTLLPRLREPIRRLGLLDSEKIEWFRRRLGAIRKEKHFINTINQIILLHYYKSTPLFADHLGRELGKVHKKVHWRLIHSFRNLLLSVPSHPTIRRQFYGLVIEIKGRPKGRARTFIFRMREGSLAPQSYSLRISFGMGEALAKVGALGVKIWITY